MLSAFLSGRTSFAHHLRVGLGGSLLIGLLALALSTQDWVTGLAAISWTTLSAGLMAAALLWAATWVWTAWHWATLAVAAGRGLLLGIAAMGTSVALALVSTLLIGDRLHPLLSTWNGMTVSAYTPVGVRYLPAQEGAARGQLLLFGDLGPGSADRLEQALTQYPHVRMVNLDSSRGLVTEALAMAQQVRARDLDTHAKGRCTGPCALVWMAGAVRGVGPQGALAFHQAYAPILPFWQPLGRADEAVYRFYLSLDVPPSMAQAMVGAAAHQPWVPDAAALALLGVPPTVAQ